MYQDLFIILNLKASNDIRQVHQRLQIGNEYLL